MKKRGTGFACSFQGVNYHFGHADISSVELVVRKDHSFLIRTAASDLGEGLEAMLITVASKTWNGFPPERIFWEGSNTNSPEAGGTGASRQSTLTGNALFQACRKMQAMLCPTAAELLDCPPESVLFLGTQVHGENKTISINDLFEEASRMGMVLDVSGSFQAPMTTQLSQQQDGLPINQFGYATYMAEVEVDTTTGEVIVLKIEAFHDAGTILNYIGASGQVEGGVVMGMGFALSEDYILDKGNPVNVGFTNYIIPSITDAPDIQVHFLNKASPIGELGVKGLAEIPTSTTAPAIINAIFNATGARIKHIPASPEQVLAALESIEEHCE